MNTLSAAVDNVFLESGTLVFQGEYSDSGFWDAVPQGQGMVAGNGWVAACGRRNNLYVNLRVELRAGEGADAPEQDGQATEAPLELGDTFMFSDPWGGMGATWPVAPGRYWVAMTSEPVPGDPESLCQNSANAGPRQGTRVSKGVAV